VAAVVVAGLEGLLVVGLPTRLPRPSLLSGLAMTGSLRVAGRVGGTPHNVDSSPVSGTGQDLRWNDEEERWYVTGVWGAGHALPRPGLGMGVACGRCRRGRRPA
jgi:hypothetical protein